MAQQNVSFYHDEKSPLFKIYLDASELTPTSLGERSRFTKDDVLLVIDMQADFIPNDPVNNPKGGRFGVPEGWNTVDMIVQLIKQASADGATVVATRDYHPADHASFMPQGGPFPPHCIQGSEGSKLVAPIANALADAHANDASRVHVAFKGFHEYIDSFGGLPYVEGGEGRISRNPDLEEVKCDLIGCQAAPWTGSLVLKQSNLFFDGARDMNAPPDLLAAVEDGVKGRTIQRLHEIIGGKRLFVCGLALDYCCMDTCRNAVAYGFKEVNMVLDAARAAHVPGLGQFSGGFLQDPKLMAKWLKDGNIGTVATSTLLGKQYVPPPPPPPAQVSRGLAPAAPVDAGWCSLM